jgi:flagellar hook protein FlgE
MIGSLQTGLTGLEQFQEDLQVIGNNIANVDTVGYKSQDMSFENQLSENLTNGNGLMQVGEGVGAAGINSDFSQGTINTTGTFTDLAVNGNGYFVVKDPSSGASYVTRDGEFNINSSGYLVTANGYQVQGYTGTSPYSSSSTIGSIQITNASAAAALNDATTPAPTITNETIDSSGNINVTLSDGVNGSIGQIVLQNFTSPQALVNQGNNLYSYDANAGPMSAPAAANSGSLGQIQSGAIESSNVDLATQMADLITAQRAFEANAKMVTTSDEILQDVINLKR